MDDPSNQDAHVVQDSLNAFDLTQHVKIPTHDKGHTLDLIITTKSTGFNNDGDIIPGPYTSYHRLLILETTIDKIKPKATTTSRKSVENITIFLRWSSMIRKFSTVWQSKMPSITLQQKCSGPSRGQHHKILKITNRKPKPWYDEDLKQQRTIMKNREHKWIKYWEDHLWKAYARERNRYNTMLKFKKNDCLHRIITANLKDTRKLFKLVSEITGCNMPNPMPDAPNNKELKISLNSSNKIR